MLFYFVTTDFVGYHRSTFMSEREIDVLLFCGVYTVSSGLVKSEDFKMTSVMLEILEGAFDLFFLSSSKSAC